MAKKLLVLLTVLTLLVFGACKRDEAVTDTGTTDTAITTDTSMTSGDTGMTDTGMTDTMTTDTMATDTMGTDTSGTSGIYGQGSSQGGGTYGGGYASPGLQHYGESTSYGRGAYNERSGAGSYGQGTQGFRGRGPKGYARSDERLREDLCEKLTDDPYIDASEIDLTVSSGTVTIEGDVESRWMKHRIEDLVDSCQGVKTIENKLRVAGLRSDDESRSASRSNPSGTTGTTTGTGASGTTGTPTGESKTSRH